MKYSGRREHEDIFNGGNLLGKMMMMIIMTTIMSITLVKMTMMMMMTKHQAREPIKLIDRN